MLQIQVHTMLIIFVVGSLVSIVLLLADLHGKPENPLDKLFALGRLVQLLGWILIALRDRIPATISYALGNSILLVGFALESHCLLSLKHRPGSLPALPWIAVVALALPFLWFAPAALSLGVAMVLAGLPAVLIFTAPALALLAKTPRSRLQTCIGLLYLAYPLGILFRDSSLLASASYALYVDSLGQDLCLLGFFVSSSASLAGYLLIKNELAATELCRINHARLEEKDVSMREFRHRVKNNLNIVASLLELESSRLTEEADRSIFVDTESRIHALSAMYDKLGPEGNDRLVNLPFYVGALAKSLKAGVLGRDLDLDLDLEIQDLNLDSKRAVDLGLIVNEAVTNALKYGVPRGKRGRILVSLSMARPGRLCLEVRDNGPGLPPDFDPAASGGLGMTLMSALAGQLEGSFHLLSDQGTRMVVDFPYSPADPINN